MDRLPAETILQIASYICDERAAPHRSRRPVLDWIPVGRFYSRMQAQKRLAAWAGTSKRYSSLLAAPLLSDPILTSHKRALAWSRRYTDSVSTFTLSKKGQSALLPAKPTSIELVYPPIEAVCRADYRGKWEAVSFSPASPPPISVPVELGLFSALTSITLEHVHLDTDFLPRLVGPGAPVRTQVKTLQLIKSLPAPAHVTSRTLSFLFDLFYAFPPDEIEYLRQEAADDDDEEMGGVKVWEEQVSHDDPLDFGPSGEAKRRWLFAASRTDWELFSEVWTDTHAYEGPTALPLPLDISTFPFSNLVYLSITVPVLELLSLIFDRPFFPSLRNFKVDGGIGLDPVGEEFFLDTLLPLFRYSITRLSPSSHGLFRSPTGTPQVQTSLVPFTYDHSWILPLSRAEQHGHGHPYRGPSLDRLDMGGIHVVYES